MGTAMLTIDRIDQLPRLLASSPETRFHLALPDLSRSANREIELDLRQALHDSGSIEVWFALAVGIPLAILLWFVLAGTWLWAMLVPFALMGAAKWLGYSRGRRRLRRIIRAVEAGHLPR